MLVATWLADPHRPTRDIDLLGFGDPDPNGILQAFREMFAVKVDDGVEFDSTTLRADQIREDQQYGGIRIRSIATVDGARVSVVVDVGFGDAVEPGVEEVEIPVLLGLPSVRLRAFARETVIAPRSFRLW